MDGAVADRAEGGRAELYKLAPGREPFTSPPPGMSARPSLQHLPLHPGDPGFIPSSDTSTISLCSLSAPRGQSVCFTAVSPVPGSGLGTQ